MKWYEEVISEPVMIIMEVTTNTKCSKKVKLITCNGQVAYWRSKSALSIFIRLLYVRLLFENALKLGANHFCNTFAENCSLGECALESIYTQKMSRLFFMSDRMCVCTWMMYSEAVERTGLSQRLENNERGVSVSSVLPPGLVLVALCLHGAHILCGEVLSSLVWPDLFTLQARLQLSNTYQNIYSPSARLFAPSTKLHHIFNPSTTVLFFFCWVFLVFWPYTFICLTSKFPPHLSLLSHLYSIYSLSFFSLFKHSFENAIEISKNIETTKRHRAEVT